MLPVLANVPDCARAGTAGLAASATLSNPDKVTVGILATFRLDIQVIFVSIVKKPSM
jgi:hypothetical protein